MREVAMSGAVAVSAWWTPLAVVLLGLFVWAAAALDGVLTARAGGTHRGAALVRPVDATVRLLRQRRVVTLSSDRPLWRIGGAGLLVAALLMLAVTPLGHWTLSDLDVGVVWFNAMDVAVWALVWLTGWGANSVHPLVGGYRFLALALGYELPLMFALTAPPIAAHSLDVGVIAGAQGTVWNVVWMPVAFVVYCVGVLAFSVWGPFAAPIEPDIAGGVRADLSGVDRLLFEGGRLALLVAGAAFAVPMFLGGGSGPLLPAWAWTLVKTAALVAVLVWLRRRLPVLRPDLLLEVGWLVLLPAALLQDLLVAVVAVWVR